jgi:hypothetical protein
MIRDDRVMAGTYSLANGLNRPMMSSFAPGTTDSSVSMLFGITTPLDCACAAHRELEIWGLGMEVRMGGFCETKKHLGRERRKSWS